MTPPVQCAGCGRQANMFIIMQAATGKALYCMTCDPWMKPAEKAKPCVEPQLFFAASKTKPGDYSNHLRLFDDQTVADN